MEGGMYHVETRVLKALVLLFVYFSSIKKLGKQISNECMCTHTHRLI